MIRNLGFLLSFLLAGAVSAQTVTVRSGDHDTFTRLVMPIPDGSEWTVERDGSADLHVRFDEPAARFDTSTVFDRIDRARIADMRPVENELTIRLACACEYRTFVHDGAFLVLDLVGDEPLPKQLDVGEAPPSAEVAVDANAFPLARDFTTVRIGRTASIGAAQAPDVLLPSFRLDDQELTGSTDSDGVSALSRAIFENIAGAATNGLLRPVPDRIHATDSGVAPVPNVIANGQKVPKAPSDTALRLSERLDHIDPETDVTIAIGGTRCTDFELVDVPAWGTPNINPGQLSDGRADLYGEFDRANSEQVLQQAKALIYFGFGAEARAVLSLMSAPPQQLVALSYAVDGEISANGALDGQTDCQGAPALWSVIGSDSFGPETPLDSNSVIQSFEALPAHLRDHLGPIMARKLTEVGASDTAESILRRLERMHGEETPAISLARGEMTLQEGHADEAASALLPLARTSGPESTGAVVATVEAAHRSDRQLPKDIVELSGALAKELKGSDDGPSLWRAHVLALLNANRFSDSLAAFRDGAGVSSGIVQKTGDDLVAAFVADAPDATFLKSVVDVLGPVAVQNPGENLERLLKRLTDLGVPDLALQIIETVPSRDRSDPVRLIQARALLDMFRPEAAELLLIGMQGEDVDHMRAEARSAMGDHAFAQSAFAELGDENKARDAAWLAGDWAAVEGENDALAQAARLAAEDTVAPEPVDLTLSAADSLASESAATRQTLQALLDETQLTLD